MLGTSKTLPCLYCLCGLLAFSVDQFLNWEFMIKQEKAISALVFAVPVSGLLCAIAWPATWISFARRDWPNSVILLLVFLFLAIFSLGASINRAGESYDRKIFYLQNENQTRIQAYKFMQETKNDWISKDQAVQAELNKGGCGRICNDKKTSASVAYKRFQEAKDRLNNLGPPISVDPLARRIASLFQLPEEWVQLAYPLFLPVGIWMASIGFIGAAIRELTHGLNEAPVTQDDQPIDRQITNWMKCYQRKNGRRPTQREAAQYFKLSESTVSRKLANMKYAAND